VSAGNFEAENFTTCYQQRSYSLILFNFKHKQYICTGNKIWQIVVVSVAKS